MLLQIFTHGKLEYESSCCQEKQSKIYLKWKRHFASVFLIISNFPDRLKNQSLPYLSFLEDKKNNMNFKEAKNAISPLLKQKGKAKNGTMISTLEYDKRYVLKCENLYSFTGVLSD
ncbi:MAG: hypothetical protein KAR45_12680 [Desulfobacteraceae bacterium]|nr:hypothetical protein [Desulfobacteraceae bacterium]